MNENNIVIFDGVCVFCSRLTRFILRHEADHVLRFAPMQSTTGARLMRNLGIDPEDAETFVLIADGRVFMKSDAAFEVARYLRGAWTLLRAFKWLPKSFRDGCYDLFARNRYQWFGRYDQCMVPPDDIAARFIVD